MKPRRMGPCVRRDDGQFRFNSTNTSSRSRGAMRPRFCKSPSPYNQRAQGKPGARCTRGLVCGIARVKTHTSIQVQRRHPTFPAQWSSGLYVLSPVTGLSCHHHPEKRVSQELDTQRRGARTTRFRRTRPTRPSFARRHVHRHPSRVRDVRETPPEWDGMRKRYRLICNF